MQATLERLEALFDSAYPINHQRAEGSRAPRWAAIEGDVYYSGGAYYFSTLGASEFCFSPPRRTRRDARSAQVD